MEFRPRKIINGKLLAANIGKHISIMLKIEDTDGGSLTGISTDDVNVCVKTQEQISARGWMEIIGQPTAAGAVRASEVIVFEGQEEGAVGGGDGADAVEPFDVESHNMLVNFLNNKPEEDLFLLGGK